jgi:hypothetical protein
VYKRAPAIFYPRSEMVARSPYGIAYLRPAATLLFKAKNTREKDRSDFNRALPLLSAEERQWLARHLTLLHPEHDWLRTLR